VGEFGIGTEGSETASRLKTIGIFREFIPGHNRPVRCALQTLRFRFATAELCARWKEEGTRRGFRLSSRCAGASIRVVGRGRTTQIEKAGGGKLALQTSAMPRRRLCECKHRVVVMVRQSEAADELRPLLQLPTNWLPSTKKVRHIAGRGVASACYLERLYRELARESRGGGGWGGGGGRTGGARCGSKRGSGIGLPPRPGSGGGKRSWKLNVSDERRMRVARATGGGF